MANYRWLCYELGRLEGAHLIIKKLIGRGKTQKDTRYVVRYDCCTEDKTISHHSIKERIRRKSKYCKDCINRPAAKAERYKLKLLREILFERKREEEAMLLERERPKAFWIGPRWEVPESVRFDPYLRW